MSTASASSNPVYTGQASSATTSQGAWTLQWTGIKNSYGVQDTEEIQLYTVDTGDWPYHAEWGSQARYWIKLTSNTGTADTKTYHFAYRWDGEYPEGYPDWENIDELTRHFAPLAEEIEVAPEIFMKWLEEIGHDRCLLRQSYRMQKEMMKETGQMPPWDPRKIKKLEEARQKLAERLEEFEPETREEMRANLEARWGITEIPPITPDLLDQIQESSQQFLTECLSPQERRFFDEHGHIRVKSRSQPSVVYVIKRGPRSMIERHIDGKHVDNICYQSKWSGLPGDDIVAMKVLDVKYNEAELLKVGNIFQTR